MSARDAIVTVITHVDRIYDDDIERSNAWKKMATELHIPIVEDEAIVAARKKAALAAVAAEYGLDLE